MGSLPLRRTLWLLLRLLLRLLLERLQPALLQEPFRTSGTVVRKAGHRECVRMIELRMRAHTHHLQHVDGHWHSTLRDYDVDVGVSCWRLWMWWGIGGGGSGE